MNQTNRFFTTFPGQVTGDEHLFIFPSPRIVRSPQTPTERFHRHSFYEVVWLMRGRAAFICDFQRYELEAGTLVFIAPGRLHTWEGDWEAFDLVLFGFKSSLFSRHSYSPQFMADLSCFDLTAVPVLFTDGEDRSGFDHLFRTALARFQTFGHRDEPLLLGYLTLILLEARRLYPVVAQADGVSAGLQLTQTFRHLVEQHFTERIEVQAYAAMLGVTFNHLVERVRETSGFTPKQIIQARLLLEAKRLLLTTPDAIGAISSALGFESQAYFGQWFKTQEGMTPSAFRALHQLP